MSPAWLFYSDPRRSGAQLTTHPAVFGSSGAQRGCRRRIEKESLTNFPLQPLETNLGRAAAMRRSPLERRRRHQLWSLQCQPPRLARSVDGRARARRHVIPDLRVAWRGVRHQTDQASWRRKKSCAAAGKGQRVTVTATASSGGPLLPGNFLLARLLFHFVPLPVRPLSTID
jgi:hypothetical protein